jgi:4-hydroxy-tetrahydrodipicolinate synthase
MISITGSIVALVTPMNADGSVDYEALRALIDWHIEQGTDCIGAVGTTGESPTVTHAEEREIIRVSVEHAKKRVPIMAGAGSNNTAEAVAMQQYCAQVGADCTLQVVPYYNRPTQEGMYQHFKAIAESANIPTILYNVPGRTVADMSNDTIVRLAQLHNIVGVKDASANIDRGAQLIRAVPKHFAVYSGDDGTACALMLLGGHGNVSVTANVAPKLMHEMCAAAVKGDAAKANELNRRLMPLNSKLFVEPNPIPVKWALQRMGKIKSGMRLPLTPLSVAYEPQVLQAMREVGVI